MIILLNMGEKEWEDSENSKYPFVNTLQLDLAVRSEIDQILSK